MIKRLKIKSQRLFILLMGAVLLISLSACGGAGNPTGKLNVDDVYAQAGKYSVTYGELWNELKWSSKTVLDEKIREIVLNPYYRKISLILEKPYSSFTDEEKKLFSDSFSESDFNALKETYQQRITEHVINDIYNLEYDPAGSHEDIDDIEPYDAKKLILKYCDEMYTTYGVEKIDNRSLADLCNDITDESYLKIAIGLKDVYYYDYAEELLATEYIENEVQKAYDTKDKNDEDDLGYFEKDDYLDSYRKKFANQGDLNLILIRFADEDEFQSTLRSFGLKVYKNSFVYIPKNPSETFVDYCKRYEELTISETASGWRNIPGGDVAVLELYIQMYNYLYGGYRELLYTDQYRSDYAHVDLTHITNQIITKYSTSDDTTLKEQFQQIVDQLKTLKDTEAFNTYYTRKYLDNISENLSTYAYNTLSLPFEEDEDTNSKCYSTSLQTYNDLNWLVFKLEQEPDEYPDVYERNIVDDDLFQNIQKNQELYDKITVQLKKDAVTSSILTTALEEETDKVKVKIYDEALEISYASQTEGYSKTYGSAPNKNVLATISYDGKSYHLNIVEDPTDTSAVSGGVFDELELQNGSTIAIDLLSKKVIKDTKEYEETAKEKDQYNQSLELVLASFANDGFSSQGYPSSLGKYNFMMLYYHTANVNQIIRDFYRVNAASAKLLTNYNSETLLNFFSDYSKKLYQNFFSVSGKRLVVYLDANDDGERDEISEWSEAQKTKAQELILKILTMVASNNDSHDTAITELVDEYNTSARAIDENDPIAPENDWAEFKDLGLSLSFEEVSATNSTTSLDFNLKKRLLDIFENPSFSINETVPTEYIEDLKSADDICISEDGYNLLLVTSADFKTSFEFESEDDPLELYQNVSIYYNDNYVNIGSILNDAETITLPQIQLYVLEYVTKGENTLIPSELTDAYTNFLSPILTRYTGTETQRDIILHFIETKTGTSLTFKDPQSSERMVRMVEINHDVTDDYVKVYFDADTTNTLQTYDDWWTKISEIVGQILLKGDAE